MNGLPHQNSEAHIDQGAHPKKKLANPATKTWDCITESANLCNIIVAFVFLQVWRPARA